MGKAVTTAAGTGASLYFCDVYTLKKSLGQHFLHDDQMCRKIVEQVSYSAGMRLLEVGPGGGAITRYLCDREGITYLAVEVDKEKVDYLERAFPSLKGRIIHEDILRSAAPFEEPFSVIGNFPYNISSPIMFKILEWGPKVHEVIGMFQKEVGQRIAAGPGSKTYGILSVLLQAYYKVEYLFDVHENCFTPPPKVKSGVLRFTNIGNPHGISNPRKFANVVKTAFNQRRKTLRNALRGLVPATMLELPVMDKRAEQLSVADFVALYNTYEDS